MAAHKQRQKQLEDLRTTLQAELEQAQSQASEGMGYSTHQADHASIAFEQAADLAMRQNAERMLYDVERALQRIEDGVYGQCRSCGQSIDRSRLDALPYARYCINCAAHSKG